MRFTGWDRGIGTLLGAILAGRAKSQDTESLRKILDQQRRRGRTMDDMSGIESGSIPMDMATDQEGMFGNAPWTSPQDTPYIPNSQFPQVEQSGGFLGSLGDALSMAGRYTLEGFTPGNAEAGPIMTEIGDVRRDIKRKQTLRDAMMQAQAMSRLRIGEKREENEFPLGPARRDEIGLLGEQRRLEQQMQDAAAMARAQLQEGGANSRANLPARMTEFDQEQLRILKTLPTEEQQAILRGRMGGGRQQRRDPRAEAMDALAQGAPLPGFTLQETKNLALGTKPDFFSQLNEAAPPLSGATGSVTGGPKAQKPAVTLDTVPADFFDDPAKAVQFLMATGKFKQDAAINAARQLYNSSANVKKTPFPF